MQRLEGRSELALYQCTDSRCFFQGELLLLRAPRHCSSACKHKLAASRDLGRISRFYTAISASTPDLTSTNCLWRRREPPPNTTAAIPSQGTVSCSRRAWRQMLRRATTSSATRWGACHQGAALRARQRPAMQGVCQPAALPPSAKVGTRENLEPVGTFDRVPTPQRCSSPVTFRPL